MRDAPGRSPAATPSPARWPATSRSSPTSRAARPRAATRGWRPAPSRVLARLSADRDRLVDWLGRDDVDPSVRWAAVQRLAELGDADAHRRRVPRATSRSSGHHAALTARALVPTEAAKAEAWERLMSGELGSHEFDAVADGFWGWEQAELVRPYLDRYVADGLALARRSRAGVGRRDRRRLPAAPAQPGRTPRAARRRRLRARGGRRADGPGAGVERRARRPRPDALSAGRRVPAERGSRVADWHGRKSSDRTADSWRGGQAWPSNIEVTEPSSKTSRIARAMQRGDREHGELVELLVRRRSAACW